MLEFFNQSKMAHVCFLILVGQGVLFFALYATHCFASAVRHFLGPIRLRRKKVFDQFIESLLLMSIKNGADGQKRTPPHFYWFEKAEVREAIFSHLIELKGDAKVILFQLYRDLGFFKLDIKSMFSKRSWKRFNTAVRLQHMGMVESDRALKRLRHDPSPLISELVAKHLERVEKRSWQRSL